MQSFTLPLIDRWPECTTSVVAAPEICVARRHVGGTPADLLWELALLLIGTWPPQLVAANLPFLNLVTVPEP